MSLTGIWKNNYGSTMDLEQYDSGLVGGRYKSSTGSTGVYYVMGFADGTEPTIKAGQTTALSIYWRSIEGGTGDASWHWVSGLSGQLSVDGAGNRTLTLMHGLVATIPFPGLAGLGTYIDKLIYLPTTGAGIPGDTPDVRAIAAAKVTTQAINPVEGTWVCQQDPSITLSVGMFSEPEGIVISSMTRSGQSFGLIGFTDVYAQSGGLSLQSLSVSGYEKSTGLAISLAGSLDYQTGILSLTNFNSEAEPADSIYLQTRIAGWTFRRS